MTEWGLTRLQLFLSLAWTRSFWHELWLKVWNVLGKQNRVACWWHFPFSGKAPFCSFCGVAWKAYKKCRTIKDKICHCSITFPTLTRSCFHLRKHICKISPVCASPALLSLAHHKVHVPLTQDDDQAWLEFWLGLIQTGLMQYRFPNVIYDGYDIERN